MEIITTACEYLMSVRLMAYVPNKLIVWRIKNVMQRYGHFHHTERSTKVTAFF
jgi:hypothetical protein